MKGNVKKVLLSAAVIVFFLVLAVGSTDDDNDVAEVVEPEEEAVAEDAFEVEEEDKVEVAFDETIEITDNLVTISGTTNLEDGTIIEYEIENFADLDDFIYGEIVVQDGEFYEEVDISEFGDGEISAWIAFYPFNQPENIQELYGSMGEYLSGDVEYSEGMQANYITAERLHVKETPIIFSGSGDTATEDFYLRSGFAVLEFSHTGSRNIIVELMDETASSSELMINEIGSYQGKTMALIQQEGNYLLKIQADGSWEAQVTQSPDEVLSTPLQQTGQGDDVFFVELASGRVDFSFSHSGTSNFIVMVNNQALLVNEIGAYEGSTVDNVPEDGIYAISVQADGSWQVNIE